jgi:PhzF family phenazine biosynthesis protein
VKEDRILKTIPIFQVDAFSTQLFSGNPAAVCPVSGFLADQEMIAIAAENNLSETAFVDLTTDPFFIRWFTPRVEVNLCGHATLAAARILFDEYLPYEVDCVELNSRSGRLSATREKNLIYLYFPTDEPKKINENILIEQALGHRPVDLLKGKDDILAVFYNEAIKKNNSRF